MPEALVCPFCRTKLVDESRLPKTGLSASEKPVRPGILQVMVYNLLCPGMGAWKLGHRLRGVIICGLVTASLLIYAGQITPLIQKRVNQALTTGRTDGISSLQTEIGDNPWVDVAFWLYVLSFVDAYFLLTNAAKPGKSGDAT